MLTAGTLVLCRYVLSYSDRFIVNGTGGHIVDDNSRLGGRRSRASKVGIGEDADDRTGRDTENQTDQFAEIAVRYDPVDVCRCPIADACSTKGPNAVPNDGIDLSLSILIHDKVVAVSLRQAAPDSST